MAADPAVVRTIIRVGRQMGAGRREILAALAAALVESGARNVNYGDRDSLGVFQQRPSQGWGTPRQVMNVEYASRKFYTVLMRQRWRGTIGQMAQRVQRSAYPGRYDQRLGDARGLLTKYSKGHGGKTVRPSGGKWVGGKDGGNIVPAARKIANHFGLSITSTWRSHDDNRRVGGAPNSDHLWGGGVDFSGSQKNMDRMAAWARRTGAFRWVGWQVKGHYDHVHLSWHKNGTQSFQLGGKHIGPGGGVHLPEREISDVQFDMPKFTPPDISGSLQRMASGGSSYEQTYGMSTDNLNSEDMWRGILQSMSNRVRASAQDMAQGSDLGDATMVDDRRYTIGDISASDLVAPGEAG